MKRFTLMVITASVLVTMTADAADNNKNDSTPNRRERTERRETKADIDKLIREINTLDNSPAAMRVGMAAVSKETAVPLPTIEAEHKQHPKVGLAGLFVAHELSTHTHKPVNQFIKQHNSGKTWMEIAAAHNQDVASIEKKLANIEQSMRDAK